MPRFDSERAGLLLRDIEATTRGEMAGLQLEVVPEPDPHLQGIADRLALVRLGVRLAEAGLAAEGRVIVDEHGHLREPGASARVLDIVLTDDPLLPRPPLRH
jgi:hypothetical protein